MMYTLEQCEKIWDDAGKHGTPQERIIRTKQWFPYYSYLAKLQNAETWTLPATPSPLVAFLLREGVLTEQDSILDIGAGMGNYVLEMAHYCRSVTALEPNPDCLYVIRQRAEKVGIQNIKTIASTWEEYVPEDISDISISSMCPAICDTSELRRMEAVTRRTCCLVAVSRGSFDKHRKSMMAELGIIPQGGMATEAIHYINALYLMDRQPNVKTLTMHSISRLPVQRVMEQYSIYFEIFGVPTEKSKTFLEDYLARHSVNGFLEDESQINQSVIYWNVPKSLR